METNYHLELATKYLKIQERQRQASKRYYEKNKERLIKLNLDKINEIKETEEYKAKKARWNKTTLEKTKAIRDAERAANPNAKPRGRPLKQKLIECIVLSDTSEELEQNLNYISSSTSSDSLSDILKNILISRRDSNIISCILELIKHKMLFCIVSKLALSFLSFYFCLVSGRFSFLYIQNRRLTRQNYIYAFWYGSNFCIIYFYHFIHSHIWFNFIVFSYFVNLLFCLVNGKFSILYFQNSRLTRQI